MSPNDERLVRALELIARYLEWTLAGLAVIALLLLAILLRV